MGSRIQTLCSVHWVGLVQLNYKYLANEIWQLFSHCFSFHHEHAWDIRNWSPVLIQSVSVMIYLYLPWPSHYRLYAVKTIGLHHNAKMLWNCWTNLSHLITTSDWMFEILVLLFLNSYLVTGILFVQNLNTGEDTRVIMFIVWSDHVHSLSQCQCRSGTITVFSM